MEERILVALIGSGGIGSKSALIIKVTQDFFMTEYDPTIQDSYATRLVVDDLPVRLYTIDTAGQEEYAKMREPVYRVCQGFLLGYSVISRSSFNELDTFISHVRRTKERDNIPMVLVGNKIDLEDDREVTKQEGQDLANQYGIPFFETSVKDNINLTECLAELVRQVRMDKQKTLQPTKPEKKGLFSKKTSTTQQDPYLYVPPETQSFLDAHFVYPFQTQAGLEATETQSTTTGFKHWLLLNRLDLHPTMARLELDTVEDVESTILVMTKEELEEYEIPVSLQSKFSDAIAEWRQLQNNNAN